MIAQASSSMIASSSSSVSSNNKKISRSSFTPRTSSSIVTTKRKTVTKRDNTVTRSSLIDQHATEVISNLAKGGGIPGVDTTEFDQMFVNVASFILPAWGIIVGTIFFFGTIAKVAYPEKYDELTTRAEKEAIKGKLDLDNLSEDDLAAVAELEAEMKAKGKM